MDNAAVTGAYTNRLIQLLRAPPSGHNASVVVVLNEVDDDAHFVDPGFRQECVHSVRLTGLHQLLSEPNHLRLTLPSLQTLSEAVAEQERRYSWQHRWNH